MKKNPTHRDFYLPQGGISPSALETPLDPERLARELGWLEAGVKLAIADLERIVLCGPQFVASDVLRAALESIVRQLRRTLEGEQGAGQ